MKYRDSEGNFKEVILQANDSIPAGGIIEYDGDTVPDGYEKVEDKGEIYSTEEVKIGTWIDGKPIYKKTIYLTSNISRNTENVITHNISNFEILIDYEGGFVRNDGKNEPIPMAHKIISDWGTSCYDFDSTKFTLWIGTLNNSFTITKAWITLYYTKTTD